MEGDGRFDCTDEGESGGRHQQPTKGQHSPHLPHSLTLSLCSLCKPSTALPTMSPLLIPCCPTPLLSPAVSQPSFQEGQPGWTQGVQHFRQSSSSLPPSSHLLLSRPLPPSLPLFLSPSSFFQSPSRSLASFPPFPSLLASLLPRFLPLSRVAATCGADTGTGGRVDSWWGGCRHGIWRGRQTWVRAQGAPLRHRGLAPARVRLALGQTLARARVRLMAGAGCISAGPGEAGVD